MKRWLIIFCLVFCVLGSGWFGYAIMNAKASELQQESLERYYKCVLIKNGESLWSIAEHFSQNSPMSTSEYVRELRRMNRLKEDTIHEGQYLTVVYFQ